MIYFFAPAYSYTSGLFKLSKPITMAEQKNNAGSLFKNDKREKDTHPHAKGSCMIDGVEYWVSAWRRTSQAGTEYTSLAFTRKETQQVTEPKVEPTLEAPRFDDGGDLPF